MKKFLKIFLWIIIILIFIGTFVYLFLNSKSKTVEYELVSPVNSDIERTTILNGKIEPRDEIDIKPQVSGIISEINVEPGDYVNEGDIIAKIKIIPDESQLSSARNRTRIAKLDLEEKRLQYERTKALFEKKFESREKYEQDQKAYEKAQEEYNAAHDALAIIRDGISTENAHLSNTLVRATITGLVLEVPVKVGNSVIQTNTMNEGTTIAKVANMNNLIFKGKIDEIEVDMLADGMPMHISIGAIDNSSLDAVIEKIAPIATEENGTNTFEIKAAIKETDDLNLRAGYSANASVVLAKASNVLVVPERVIEFIGDSTFVYVLESDPAQKEQKFSRTNIKTGISDGINIQVIGNDISTDSKLRGAEINKH